MDPSERRALAYHLGITWTVAWARQTLRIPWLLHLDIYQRQLGINTLLGNSRPDLVGLHPNGAWAVFEAKGRASAPSPAAETKAKNQSQRVVTIGGVAPTSCFAAFSYFATDRQAVGRRKPKIVHSRILDPAPNSDDDQAIHLPLLTQDKFFELYYQPWFRLLSKPAGSIIADVGSNVASSHLPALRPELFFWRYLADLDFYVGMLPGVALALEQRRYGEVPKLIQEVTSKEGLEQEYPDWAGDGMIIEPGDSWKKLWYERNEKP
jgi:hypothetical protein